MKRITQRFKTYIPQIIIESIGCGIGLPIGLYFAGLKFFFHRLLTIGLVTAGSVFVIGLIVHLLISVIAKD